MSNAPTTPHRLERVAQTIAASWQRSYDLWESGRSTSPSADDLAFDALTILGLRTDSEVRESHAEWLFEAPQDGSMDLIDLARGLLDRIYGS